MRDVIKANTWLTIISTNNRRRLPARLTARGAFRQTREHRAPIASLLVSKLARKRGLIKFRYPRKTSARFVTSQPRRTCPPHSNAKWKSGVGAGRDRANKGKQCRCSHGRANFVPSLGLSQCGNTACGATRRSEGGRTGEPRAFSYKK